MALTLDELRNKTLLLLGHGSSIHPDSSKSVRMHADAIRELNVFADVYCAFLKEDLLIENALDEIGHDNVIIVYDFLAEGYFTKQAIPKLLELATRSENIRVSQPVGLDNTMQSLLAESAHNLLRNWKAKETSLLLVGHGSTKNAKSKQTMLDHMVVLREHTEFADIGDLWLEEAPFVNDWAGVAQQKQVIAVPFLLSGGQHGGWDIPEEFGIEKGKQVLGVTHLLDGRLVRMAPALGSTFSFAKVIIPAALEARKLAPIAERITCLYEEECISECFIQDCPGKRG
ncbi:MAG: CbiX/SirB N-terminal domain-containing protein [Akkermansiaceae bacterium]